jgi:hypothetical protein
MLAGKFSSLFSEDFIYDKSTLLSVGFPPSRFKHSIYYWRDANKGLASL